jgi:23S rRNA pseudouridine1911/1915/1917 synthase
LVNTVGARSRNGTEGYRAETTASNQVDDQQLVRAARKLDIDDETIGADIHRRNMCAGRQIDWWSLEGLHRSGGSGRMMSHAARDDRAEQSEPSKDHQPHDYHQSPKRLHSVQPRMSAEPAGHEINITIATEDAGLRLDRALQHQLPELSRNRLKQLILGGHVSTAGRVLRDPAMRAPARQIITLVLPPPEEAAPAAQAIQLDIRFEDAHLIVVNKPAGMVVHPAPGNPEGTLVNALLAHCGPSFAGIGGVRRPGIVHRLDKDTSGLLVAAKTEAAHRALSHDFARRDIERAYSAVVWGVPEPAAGEIIGNIGRSPSNRKKMAVVAENRGKPATTRYRVERSFVAGGQVLATLIDCRLLTGRTHQIRVHLGHIGHSLIGDPAYGGQGRRVIARIGDAVAAIAKFPRQALHARVLGFRHPVTGEPLHFEASLPADMVDLVYNLERL